MHSVTCCCCGTTVEFTDEVCDSWHPCVFDGERELGEMCPTCAERVGLRESDEDESFDNLRIDNREGFYRIRSQRIKLDNLSPEDVFAVFFRLDRSEQEYVLAEINRVLCYRAN